MNRDQAKGAAKNAAGKIQQKDAVRGDEQNSFAGPGAQIPDETKRRQIALMTRYITTVRAR